MVPVLYIRIIRGKGGDFFETKILRQILHVYFRNRRSAKLTQNLHRMDSGCQWFLGNPYVGERFCGRSLLLYGLAGTPIHQKIKNSDTFS